MLTTMDDDDVEDDDDDEIQSIPHGLYYCVPESKGSSVQKVFDSWSAEDGTPSSILISVNRDHYDDDDDSVLPLLLVLAATATAAPAPAPAAGEATAPTIMMLL